MNEAEEPIPETSTPDAGSTGDATRGRFILWSAIGIGVYAIFKAIDKAASSYARQAHLERVAPRRSHLERVAPRRRGSPPMGSTAPAGPPGQGLYGSKPWAVFESGAELKRNWDNDDRYRK
jgi:hypothetical protein